jgi:hypothetical protein
MAFIYDDPALTYDDAGTTYEGLPFIFDDVTVAVEFGFGYQPLATDVVWQPVTSYVRGINVDRGRSSEFSTYGPGTCTLTVDNRDRRFDPEHTTGPFYGDLLPMVPIRVTTSYGGTDYTLFYGFVTGWPTAYNQSNSDAVSTITAVDGNRLLANTVLNPAYEQVVVSDPDLAIYFPMQPEYWRDGGYLSPQKYGLWDYTNTVKSSFNLDGTGTFTDAAAPVQVNKSFRYDTTKNVAGTHLAGWDVISAGGYGSTGEPLGFNGALKTLEVWLENVDEERADTGSIGQAFVSAAFGDDSAGYLSFLEISPEADSTLYRIRYYTDTVGHDQTGISGAQLNAEAINHLVLTANDTNVLLYLNGSVVYNVAFNDTVDPYSFGSDFRQMVFGAYSNRFAHVSVYYDTFDAAKVADRYAAGFGYTGDSSSGRLSRTLDDAGWPSAWRDIETGVQTVGAYRSGDVSARDYLEQVENAEQGELFVSRDGEVVLKSRTTADASTPVALFDDDGTDYPFANVQVDANTVDAIRNSVAVRYATDTVTVEDSGSVAAYGRAQQSLNAQLIDDPADASAIGEARLAQTKDPRTRVRRLDVNVRADTSMVPTVAGLELADDVTVSFTPTGVGDELWRAVRVQGVSHTITLERWDCQLYLAPGPIGTNGPLMLLDDDEYGKLSSGNKLG